MSANPGALKDSGLALYRILPIFSFESRMPKATCKRLAPSALRSIGSAVKRPINWLLLSLEDCPVSIQLLNQPSRYVMRFSAKLLATWMPMLREGRNVPATTLRSINGRSMSIIKR